MVVGENRTHFHILLQTPPLTSRGLLLAEDSPHHRDDHDQALDWSSLAVELDAGDLESPQQHHHFLLLHNLDLK